MCVQIPSVILGWSFYAEIAALDHLLGHRSWSPDFLLTVKISMQKKKRWGTSKQDLCTHMSFHLLVRDRGSFLIQIVLIRKGVLRPIEHKVVPLSVATLNRGPSLIWP